MTPAREVITSSQQLIAETFRSFRKTLLEHYGAAEFELKDDLSYVTKLDPLIEQSLCETMVQAYPGLGFVGEELGDQRVDPSQPYWLVDPIDSTASFIRGLPNCTNMAALIVDGRPVASVIYDFVNDKMYTALAGEGAYCDNTKLKVSSRPINNSAVYTSAMGVTSEQKQTLRSNRVAVFRPIGASGRAFVSVAEGKIEGYHVVSQRLSPHDNAPGILLATEAGAVVVTRDNRPWSVDTASMAIVVPQLVEFWRQDIM